METAGPSWVSNLALVGIFELGVEMRPPLGIVLNPSPDFLVTKINHFSALELPFSMPKEAFRLKLVIKQIMSAPIGEAFQIISAMKTSLWPVDTFAIGVQSLFGQLLFSAGAKRYVTPMTRFVIGASRFEPEPGQEGLSPEELLKLQTQYEEDLERELRRAAKDVSSFCGVDEQRYYNDLMGHRDQALELIGQEIVDYGFAHEATFEAYRESLFATPEYLRKRAASEQELSDPSLQKEGKRPRC